MTARFVACAACGRHVRAGDDACPFCGGAAPQAGPLPRMTGIRMTRAAMIAAGTAGTMAGIVDCSSSSSQPAVFYGVACTGSSCVQDESDAAADVYDAGSPAVFYGIVCTGDACSPAVDEDAASGDARAGDASDARDATGD